MGKTVIVVDVYSSKNCEEGHNVPHKQLQNLSPTSDTGGLLSPVDWREQSATDERQRRKKP